MKEKISVLSFGNDLGLLEAFRSGAARRAAPPKTAAFECRSVARAIDEGNAEAVFAMRSCAPALWNAGTAGELVPGMHRELFLIAGFGDCDYGALPQNVKTVLCAAAQREGFGDNAGELFESGELLIERASEHSAACERFSVISFSLCVAAVCNRSSGGLAFAPISVPDELLGAVVGAIKEQPTELGSLISRAVRMGDDFGARLEASRALLALELIPRVLSRCEGRDALQAAEYLKTDRTFARGVFGAAFKVTADAADRAAGSTIVTAMSACENGFGIRVSGAGDEWFCENGEFGFGDAAAEVVSLGSFTGAAAQLQRLCASDAPRPLGIDVRKACRAGGLPEFGAAGCLSKALQKCYSSFISL